MAQRNEQLGSNIRQFAVDKQEVSWRQQEVFLHGNELKTITFDDTKPNMFFIQNPSDTVIHVGISHIPTVNTYEFRVNSHNTKAFGRPIRTNRLYLLNMTNVDVSITLFSVYDKFDLNILNDIDFDFNGLMEIKSDGFLNGFSNGVELPTGNNHIGSVTVRESVLSDTLNEILNKITSHVNNTDVYDVVTTIKNVIGKDSTLVDLCDTLDNLLQVVGKDTSIINIYDSLTTIYQTLARLNDKLIDQTVDNIIDFNYKNKVTSFTFTALDNCILYFQYLCNDNLDTDIKVNNNTILTLFTGEKVTDFKIELAKNDVVTFVSSNGSYRLKYYVKGV